MAAASIIPFPPAIQVQIAKLTQKMLFLGFAASFQELIEGPVVRTFRFKAEGVSLFSRISSRGEELAMTLGVESVRIRRSGFDILLEVPREDRQIIHFDSCLFNLLSSGEGESYELPLLLGKDPQGSYLLADLTKQPHLLIAGATNSGKSVFTAQLICSLALMRSPSDLELILVDTKNLDLVLFEGLPHLKHLIREVEDLRDNLLVLLEEVRRRTKLMSGFARNIREWNSMNLGESLSYKVLIIDELADVLDTDVSILGAYPRGSKPPSIHSLLKQLAQISRAAGVHIIIATQRPSVKIISGDVKANFPARVCFKLPSQIDSRVILDEGGAEALLGLGDYLFKLSTNATIQRAHSAFVSMDDISKILSQSEEIRRQYGR